MSHLVPLLEFNQVQCHSPKFEVKSVHELSPVVYDLSAIFYCI